MDRRNDRFEPTIERFTGFAQQYDRFRAPPPEALSGLLSQLIGVAKPPLVVDLGSGTGLSTRYWADRASRVIGVEPNAEMRAEALRRTQAANVAYQAGFSHTTGLPDGCAHVITCVQALHWMDPEATFAEAGRLLVPGGVFAAIDYDWPPVTSSWRADRAWAECAELADRLEASLAGPRPPRWGKDSHLSRLRASGRFRVAREVSLHHVDQGDADRFIGLLLSQGGVMDLLKGGRSAVDLGIPALEVLARAELGTEPRPWYWTARVRFGVI